MQGQISPYIFLFAGTPVAASVSSINPGIGALVLDTTTGVWRRKTSALGDNSGYSVVADASTIVTAFNDSTVGAADGLGALRCARATFDPSLTAGLRTVGAHGLGITLPDKAIIVGGFYQVKTTFTSAADSATIAISVEGANDIVSAVAISNGANPWDAGKQPIIPKSNTPETTGVSLTAAREVTATVAVQALTAGKAHLFLFYVQGS